MDRLLTATIPYEQGNYQDDPVGFGMNVLGEFYTQDVMRVMESVRDNHITIAESANAVGKTHAAARIAIWWFKEFERETAQVYTAAAPPIGNLRKLLWGEIYNVASKHESIFSDAIVNADLNIKSQVNPQSFITGVTIPQSGTPQQREASFSGKHARYLLFILDEADAIPPEVFKGIESCLSGGHGRLLCMYNPRSDEGPIKAMKDRGVNVVKLSALDHPNVRMGTDIFPGAVTRDKTLTRINRWTVPAEGDFEFVTGYGRWQVPDWMVGATGKDAQTGDKLPPLPAGERIIIVPEFSYMVLGEYPGASVGAIYDVWLDDYETNKQGNVQDIDYKQGEGMVIWSIDDGYVGSIDPETKSFTADSHPRVIGFYQIKPDGRVVRFDELYKIREPRPEIQINEALAKGYERPEFVVLGPGSESLGGLLTEMNFFKRTCRANVEESIKELRAWIAPDENNWRRFVVHPRCFHFRHEIKQYKRDANGRIIKAFDHGPDESRYLCWIGRNGFY